MPWADVSINGVQARVEFVQPGTVQVAEDHDEGVLGDIRRFMRTKPPISLTPDGPCYDPTLWDQSPAAFMAAVVATADFYGGAIKDSDLNDFIPPDPMHGTPGPGSAEVLRAQKEAADAVS